MASLPPSYEELFIFNNLIQLRGFDFNVTLAPLLAEGRMTPGLSVG